MKSIIPTAFAAAFMFAGSAFADDVPGRNQPMMDMLTTSAIETGTVQMTDDHPCFQVAKRGVESQRGTESICVRSTGVKSGDMVTAPGTFHSGSMSDLPGRRNPN